MDDIAGTVAVNISNPVLTEPTRATSPLWWTMHWVQLVFSIADAA